MDVVLQLALHSHDRKHLEEMIESILDPVLGLQNVLEDGVHGLLHPEIGGQLVKAARSSELRKEMNAHEHDRDVGGHPARHLAIAKERAPPLLRTCEVGSEVPPKAK